MLVLAGSALGVLLGKRRSRLRLEAGRRHAELETERRRRRRGDLLARVAELLESPGEPDAMLVRIAELAVPELGDTAVIDRRDADGLLRAVAITSTDAELAHRLGAMRREFPVDAASDHPVARAGREGPLWLPEGIATADLGEFARSDRHYELLDSLRYRSAVIVPLVARGRTAGVLSCMRFEDGPTHDEEDLALARELAGRAALVLDNARLFQETRVAERRLDAIVSSLGEAVAAFEPDGKLVFANDAAVRGLGLSSEEELLSLPIPELLQRLRFSDEHGQPVPYSELPHARVLAGGPGGTMLVRAVSATAGTDRWYVTRAEPVHDEDGRLALAVVVVENVTAVRREETRQRLLASASKLITSSLDVDATVTGTAHAAIPELADWVRVDLLDERGRLREAGVAHRDPAKTELLTAARKHYDPDTDDAGPSASVLRTGRSVVVEGITPERLRAWAQNEEHARIHLALDTRSFLIAPLKSGGGQILGTMQFATTGDSGRQLTAADIPLAEDLAQRAGIAVEHARVHAARIHATTELQRPLLPPRLPVIPGLAVAARFRAAEPAGEVGGDFYDLFAIGDEWMVVIGDVTGKGPGAAAITAQARHTIRTVAVYEPEPGAVLARLNDALAVDPDRRQICTAACLVVSPRPDGALIRVACAGHPPPLLVRADGTVQPIGGPGTLLGAFPDGTWSVEEVLMAPGESLVLYTDGVTDTRGPHDRFGSERLEEVLTRAAGLAPDDVAQLIDDALEDFGEQRDDVALLVLRAATETRSNGDGPLSGSTAFVTEQQPGA